MNYTVSLKSNRDFRRIYSRGKTAGTSRLLVYCRRVPDREYNRIGYTVSTKLGHAIKRNRVRRRLREIYRLNEAQFSRGWDIVVVVRRGGFEAEYRQLEADFMRIMKKLNITEGAL